MRIHPVDPHGGPSRLPTPSGVRSVFSDDSRLRSYVRGLTLFAVAFGIYAATFAGAAAFPNWFLRVVFAVLNGAAVAGLFVVGHDACHGNLTPSRRLNRLLGQVALLPSLHPFSSWVHTHNGMHHGWTNLRGKDPVYAPLSKAEYDALSPARRFLERAYRTVPGIALLYLVEVWWRQELFPTGRFVPRGKASATFRRDRFTVLVFLTTEATVTALAPAPAAGGPGIAAALSVLVAVALPFAIWNFLMAFATFQHHTHPTVPWYDREEEWSYFAGQVRSGVHVRLPKFVEVLSHRIMDHTAHHADPKIPLYNLPREQRRLEAAFPDDVTITVWELFSFRATLRTCQLYDYESHRWLRFDGTPTTGTLLPARATLLRRAA